MNNFNTRNFNFHNINKNWGWLGGHSDGEKDQSKVALKEAKEESGIDDIKLLSSSPISIEILPVSYHIKNDKFVNSHLHFNMTYLLQANDTSELKIKPDETLEIIQNLYEKKLVTYPRTDARVLSTAVAKVISKNLNGLAKGFKEVLL